jgi:hypothetical protein
LAKASDRERQEANAAHDDQGRVIGEKGLQERAGKKEDQASREKKLERIGALLEHRSLARTTENEPTS